MEGENSSPFHNPALLIKSSLLCSLKITASSMQGEQRDAMAGHILHAVDLSPALNAPNVERMHCLLLFAASYMELFMHWWSCWPRRQFPFHAGFAMLQVEHPTGLPTFTLWISFQNWETKINCVTISARSSSGVLHQPTKFHIPMTILLKVHALINPFTFWCLFKPVAPEGPSFVRHMASQTYLLCLRYVENGWARSY